MKHVLYLMVLLLIFTNRNSALLEKLYRKNLQSAQLIESATPKRISFRLFVRTIYLAPMLVQLCKDDSIDNIALNEVNFYRTSATYKIVDGLVISKNKSVLRKMQNSHFSVKIDECTASNAMKVLSILASYFDEEMGRCFIEHYKSLED